MRRCSDLYGSKAMTVDELAAAVAAALDITETVLRTSETRGDYVGIIYEPWPGQEEVRVGPNYVVYPGEDEPEILETKYPEYPVMAWVGLTTRAEDIKRRLNAISGLDFLHRAELDWPS